MDLNIIAKVYNLGGIKESASLGGKIHQTFFITVNDGEQKKYVLQKFNDTLLGLCGDDKLQVAENWTANCEKIYSALKGENFSCARPLKQNRKFCYKNNNEIWRVFEYLENDGEAKQTPEMIFQAGKTLGRFHRIFRDKDLLPKFIIPYFHETRYYLNKLEKLFREGGSKAARIEKEFKFIEKNIKINLLPDNLPRFLLHGDPKLDNFLFKNSKLIALIDYDSMMRGSNFLDIGDGFRSWCKIDYQFQNDLFKAGAEGYSEGFGGKLNYSLALQAMRLITLELAVRYLIDYFEEKYFVWDKDKYQTAAEHNLSRAKNCINYFKSINL